GPRLLLPDGSPYASATRFPTAVMILLYETRLNRLIPRSRWLYPYRARFEGGQPFPVDAVEGSCLPTRRAIWHQVGGFDGRYFCGVEELAYAWKVTRAGYGVWVHPEPGMIHHHSGSTGGKRRGTLIRLSVTLGFLHFMQANRPTSLTWLRLPLLAIWLLKWALCRALGKSEHRVMLREGMRALIGLRPAWITVEDRARWGA
ncbi:MAG: glycosyltransferase family 2 protein, partial [Candidatus Methylomirabilis sp.]